MRIAVFGKIRAGKSAVCDYIMDNFDSVEQYEFSGAVQEVVDILYPELRGTKDRMTLVGVGQHLRKYDVDVWTNVIKYRIENSNAEHILVAGVRQQNEFDMLKELGFIFIQVDACENIRIERCEMSGDSFTIDSLRNHTELVMDDWKADYVIRNEKGFKEFEIAIRNVLVDILNNYECERAFVKDGIADFYKRNGMGDAKNERN